MHLVQRYFVFLQELKPPDGMEKSKVRDLKLKAVRYFLIDRALYWKDPLRVFLRCLNPQESQKVMFDFPFVGGIISGRPQLKKSSGLGITSPLYSLMSAEKSDLASNAKGSQESSSLDHCH